MLKDLRTERMARGLAQSELAERAKVDLFNMKKWERGLELPPRAVFVRIARVLGCDPVELRRAHTRLRSGIVPGEGYTTAASRHEEIMRRSTEPPTSKIKVLDLFCGVGGFSYGFEQTGHFAVTAGIDLLKDRVETFHANHPCATAIVGDIRNFPLSRLIREADHPDVVIGGPPCQGFSSIRPFRGLTEGDPRNSLLEYFALVVLKARARWFVFENVVGLLTHQNGEMFQEILSRFDQAGYVLAWRVLNAANFGVPQNRERLIVVGNNEGKTFVWPTASHQSECRSMVGRNGAARSLGPLFDPHLPLAVAVTGAIDDLPAVEAGGKASEYRQDAWLSEYEKLMRKDSLGLTLHEATAHTSRMLAIVRRAGASRAALPKGLTSSGFSSCYSRLDGNKPSVTLTVNFVHPASNKCIHPTQDRALTPREGARLQSFPDRFRFRGTRTQIVKQIGNAVPPLLGRAIAVALAESMVAERPISRTPGTAARSSCTDSAPDHSRRLEAASNPGR